MSFNIGDYVRTKDGVIFKLNNIIYQDDNYIQYQLDGKLEDKDFLKSNPNIIDLIEVGDYVNGFKVDEIDEKGIYNYNSYDGWRINIASCNDDIKSIVTKEQFESMEYKIGE